MNVPLDRLQAALAGRYRLEREVGAGGMATVYLALDLKHNRQVALKVLRSELAVSLGPDRFVREITIAAALSHPHVLPLYDSGEAGGFLYYVMPFVEGQSLRERLLREGELPVGEAVRILRDVADALAYAHQRGVTHRDIKPENVMLSGRHALVTDFGVAKAVSEATGRQTLTTPGVAVGTPTYMAPEQATADPHLDHRVDIYAWGVVAYELLTGRPPFDRATPQAMLAAHVTAAVEPVANRRPSIPPRLATLVMRALEKNPADRWQRAEELIQPLETLLTPSGGTTPTATQTGTSAATPATRRTTFAILGGVLIAGAAAVGTVVLWPSAPEYVPDRVVVVPLESQGLALRDFGRQMMATLTAAISQEGVGDPVAAARVRDLLAGAGDTPAEVANYLARKTGAGLVLRGACSPGTARTECQLELLRMPGSIPRLSITFAGDQADPRFPAELAERAAVILLLQQRWGDRATWRGEYIPGSLEAVRELNEGFDLWMVYDTNAARHIQRAATLDTAWVLAGVWGNQEDSTLERLGRRPGLRASDREVVGLYQAFNRGDRERAYDLAGRRFAGNPEMWLSEAVWTAYVSQRPEAAIRYFQYADSVIRVQVWVYRNAAYALHQLGRHVEEVKLAARMRERFPENKTDYRTVEILGRAGAGDLDGVRRVVAEAEATPELHSGLAGTRTWIAGIELMAHGQEAEGRRMLAASLPFYRRLREEKGPSGSWNLDLQILLITDRLEEAGALALDALPRLKSVEDSVRVIGLLGQVAARRGQRDEALRYSAQLARLDPNGAPYYRACIAARLGDREAAVRFLEVARTMRGNDGFEGLHRDPHLASLRGYPPFEQLLKPKG